MLPLMLLWIPIVALAEEPPSAAALCADAAAGTEIDVCLALAAANPDAIDGIAAALRAHVDRAEAHDRELLDAVLALFAPGGGSDAAGRLADLDDPRAVGPLAQAARGEDVEVAVAAVLALGGFPAAIDVLEPWLDDRALPTAVRIAAARALGSEGDERGGDALARAIRGGRLPNDVEEAVRETFLASYPHRADEIGRAVRRDGTIWLSAAGAGALSWSLGTAGHFGRSNLTGLGLLTGAAAGGTAGWVAGRAWPIEADDAAFVATSGGLGTASGALIGSAVGHGDGTFLGGLTGAAVGYGTGLAARRLHDGHVGDAIEASFLAGATGVAAGTAAEYAWRSRRELTPWGPPPRVPPGNLASGIGLGVGAVAGHLVAPRLRLSAPDTLLVGLATSYGLAVGMVAPVPGGRYTLPATGAAIGSLVGYGLAGPIETGADQAIGGATGMAYGAALGVGLGMVVDPANRSDGDVARWFALGGTTVGLATGTWVAYRNPEYLDPPDIVWVSLVTGWAAVQGAGWYDGERRRLGWYVLVPAAVGTAAAATTPFVDVPTPYSFGGLSLSLWGTYAGNATARLLDVRGRSRVHYSLIGSDLGLGLGLLLAAPPLSAPPLVIGIADAGGVLGASVGALGASFVTDDERAIVLSSLVGAGSGLVAGAFVGGALHRSGAARDVAWRRPAHRPVVAFAPSALPGEDGIDWSVGVSVTGW
jgi:hypothetical protein